MAPELAEAMTRLEMALGALETAVGRYMDADTRRSDLEVELGVMQDDRSRLASELESATARLGRLEAASEHVGRRLGLAIESIRAVLGPAESETRQDG